MKRRFTDKNGKARLVARLALDTMKVGESLIMTRKVQMKPSGGLAPIETEVWITRNNEVTFSFKSTAMLGVQAQALIDAFVSEYD